MRGGRAPSGRRPLAGDHRPGSGPASAGFAPVRSCCGCRKISRAVDRSQDGTREDGHERVGRQGASGRGGEPPRRTAGGGAVRLPGGSCRRRKGTGRRRRTVLGRRGGRAGDGGDCRGLVVDSSPGGKVRAERESIHAGRSPDPARKGAGRSRRAAGRDRHRDATAPCAERAEPSLGVVAPGSCGAAVARERGGPAVRPELRVRLLQLPSGRLDADQSSVHASAATAVGGRGACPACSGDARSPQHLPDEKRGSTGNGLLSY